MSLDAAPASFPTETDLVVARAFTPAAAPRRVLVYAPLAYSTPHFETDLEIAQRHLDLGDEVELVLCDGQLPSCQLNPQHESRRCLTCISRNLQGAAQLSQPVKAHSLLSALTAEDSARLAQLPAEFANQEALRKFTFDGFDAGMATLSSLIDFARALTIDVRGHATIVRGTLTSAVASFLAMQRLLAAGRYDRVYIYNGRWSMVRSAVRACEQAGVEYYTHERGADHRSFALYHNTLPHNKPDFRRKIAAAWDVAGGAAEAVALGEKFFHERRQRVEKNWFSYVKKQETGRVPADWERTNERIVFFTSSEFETAAVSEEATGRIYASQSKALPRLAREIARLRPQAHLWVRVHPNDHSPAAVAQWTSAAAGLGNVTLVRPDAVIDSYAMLDGAERVLSFGSTVSIEATFWGRPSITADDSFFDGLSALHEARSEAELLDLLTRPALPPQDRQAAIAIGYYLNTYGATFRHFDTSRISDYEFQSPFRGRCLKPDFTDLAQRVLALHQAGEDARVLPVARHFTTIAPSDATMQAILILTHLRRHDLAAATTALARVPAAVLEPVLKHTGKALLDATQLLAQTGPTDDFRANATRLSAALAQVPAYAALGAKLAVMAERRARATPAAATA